MVHQGLMKALFRCVMCTPAAVVSFCTGKHLLLIVFFFFVFLRSSHLHPAKTGTCFLGSSSDGLPEPHLQTVILHTKLRVTQSLVL